MDCSEILRSAYAFITHGDRAAGDRIDRRGPIRRLRLKLESDPGNPTLIITERGAGYRLACEVDTLY